MAKKYIGKQKQTLDNENIEKKENDAKADIKQEGTESKKEGDAVSKADTETQESAEVKLAELLDKYLRLSAEFDNYRKRTLKEKVDLIKTAGEDIILRIIPVLDDFERAIGFMNNGSIDPACEGMVLIYNKLKDILNQQGLKEIEALHKDFNTDIHEAVTKIPAAEENLKGKVVDVIEKGYFLYEKVVRYAKVVVGE